ncbi:MAG: zinc ribbon domain-containing protein, partial [Candidatus Lokiarchaeota archaeon]|nr:zinc ribbon domain-containing protein [Candidatus Lokiarchaeota archaeon]
MSPKFCPYCGNPVKEIDKFCIICGKPMLTDIPKSQRKLEIQEIKKEKEKEIFEKKPEEVESEEEPIDIETREEAKIKSKKFKEKGEVKPLPEDVKEQMGYYIEYNDIQLNKKILADKLTEISK